MGCTSSIAPDPNASKSSIGTIDIDAAKSALFDEICSGQIRQYSSDRLFSGETNYDYANDYKKYVRFCNQNGLVPNTNEFKTEVQRRIDTESNRHNRRQSRRHNSWMPVHP